MNIRVHIENLLLEGIPIALGQEGLLRAAVELELTRLLIEHGAVPFRPVTSPVADGGTIALSAAAGARQVGSQVARAVYGGINV